MDQAKLKEILDAHKEWRLSGGERGARADLADANLAHDERWYLAWRAARDAGACRLPAADSADRDAPPPEGTHPCAPCTWFFERHWCADQDAPARARCADIEPRPEDDARNAHHYATEGSAA